MAAIAGTNFTLKQGTAAAGTAIAGGRVLRFRVNNQEVDITNKDSTGLWRELLASAGVRSAEISLQGVFTNAVVEETVRGYAYDGSLNPFGITVGPAGATQDKIDASWQVADWEQSGEFNGAVAYSFTLRSSGAVTYTPGS